ncbi:MAG: nitronate monooxygenase [Burkholderiaceae bacterium]|nr:nitronate monooxygenase [Burkholderiaceae bacterium]
MLQTRLTQRYGVEAPIVQAGMAFVAGPRLAIAVCRAGAIGSLGVGLMPPPAFVPAIASIRAAVGSSAFNANLLTPFVNDEIVGAVCDAAPPIVSFHWGHPQRRWIDRLAAAGCSVWEQVGSVDAARRAVGDGVELVIAQGSEAGGHNYGSLPTFVLVPEVVDAAGGALVLAAGGVSDGRGLAAALALGADGVSVGTRMVATAEADAMSQYKDALVGAAGTDTVRTSVFGPQWPDFNPMRVLRTPLVDEYHDRVAEVPKDTGGLPVVARLPFCGQTLEMHRFDAFVPAEGTTGNPQDMPLLAGEGVGLVRSIEPAADVVQAMVRTAEQVLGRLRAT